MHTITQAVQAVPLETYGGLIALARPENVPEGASPRNYDMDFLVGSAQTRPPLESVYSYADSGVGPDGSAAAANVTITGNAWADPDNVLSVGSYASCGAAAGNSLLAGSDGLEVTEFSFDVPASQALTGVQAAINCFANTAVTLKVQLLLNGAAIGNPKPVTLPLNATTVMLGGASDLWGAAPPPNVNNTTFGVQITASSSFALASAYVGYVTLTVYQAPAAADFNFLTTFVAQDGSVKNVLLDAAGNLWIEDVTNNPRVLTLAFDGITPGSFASGVNGPGVEYLAFNDLTTGSDVPRQYTPNWTDRISQVGPGAAPVFAPSTSGVGPAATITAFAVTANVVTLTAANTFAAGGAVLFAGLTVATFLNGQTLVVSSAGLSSTQFEVGFTATNASTTADSGTAMPVSDYPIATITQPAQQVRTSSYYLYSTGPGSTSPGNVYTVYYSDSTLAGPDQDLVTAFNSGYAVYVYLYGQNDNTGSGPISQGPVTVQVTSVGMGSPPGQPRQFYYFTFVYGTGAYGYITAQEGFTVTYQRTLATLTASEPVPVIGVGSQATIAGTSVSQYNSTWPIAQALNSAAMVITQTSLTAGVATYSYNVSTGANPTAGQLVTITGTLNANGTLNGVDLVIDSVSGTNSGTFTVGGFQAATDYSPEAEQGQATTAGTEFCFDPGLLTLDGANNPIYGASTGGDLIFTGNGQYLAAGTKQGVMFFITRNGYWTCPCVPVTFAIPENTTALNVSQVPLGPPNVIARGIAVTESGANGVPGGNFFTIPTPVQYIVEGVTYTATALLINDNTSTSASFTFTDQVLLNAEAIDVQGNNLFNLIELGNPGWIVSYASRNFYGLCQNKIQNFTNLSFDGGYLPGGQLTPLGWTAPDQYGQLRVSPVFGNSYYIANSSSAALGTAGLIAQTAYEDGYLVPILNANTAYSVRVTARAPSGNTTGNLVVALTANGIVYGSFTLALAGLTTSMATYIGTLLTTQFATVPAGLQIQVSATGLGVGADVEIDRVEVFPTAIPVLSTTVFGSYAADLESVDGVTGVVQFTSENQQPVNGGVVMYDTFYGLKGSSMYSLQSSANLEPAQWNEPEVAQRVGACGVNAYDFAEQWFVTACRNGLYLFDGGQPGKIMQEIFQVWEAINWPAGKSIWVKNNVPRRRLYVGVPMATPNFYLPNAPVNPNPPTPNVMLVLNYQGCDTGDAIKTEMQLHVTMFGTLNATDMKRKWSIWQIPCPYANAVSTGGQANVQDGAINILDAEVRFGNGIGSSKVYRLNEEFADETPEAIPTDDGATINSLYTTYGHINLSKAAQMPLLGMFRKLWSYMTHQISGAGTLATRLLPNTLVGPNANTTGYYPWTLPGGFPLSDPCYQVHEAPLNFAATRTFVEFSTTGRMNISNLVMVGKKHPHNQLTGQR